MENFQSSAESNKIKERLRFDSFLKNVTNLAIPACKTGAQ